MESTEPIRSMTVARLVVGTAAQERGRYATNVYREAAALDDSRQDRRLASRRSLDSVSHTVEEFDLCTPDHVTWVDLVDRHIVIDVLYCAINFSAKRNKMCYVVHVQAPPPPPHTPMSFTDS